MLSAASSRLRGSRRSKRTRGSPLRTLCPSFTRTASTTPGTGASTRRVGLPGSSLPCTAMVSARGAVAAQIPRAATVPTPAHTITLEPRFCLRSSTVWLKLQGVGGALMLLVRLLEPKPLLARAVCLAGGAGGGGTGFGLEGRVPKVVVPFSAGSEGWARPTRSTEGRGPRPEDRRPPGVRSQSTQRS